MAYCVWFTVDATFEFPLAPIPFVPGHWTDVPNPTVLSQVALTLARYLVNTLVVPEPSDRWIVVMAWFGKVVPELRATIAGSFQLVMVPRNMLAITCPERWSTPDIPGRLYAKVTAPIVSGIW